MMHPRHWWKHLGPGVITGASDDDPSGIITYTQTGAITGTKLLWLTWLTTPMMIAAQEMSARIGLVTGKGLAAVLKKRSPHLAAAVSVLLLVANTINIGADLAAMGAVMQLLIPGSEILYTILIAGVVLILEIWLSYKRYVRVLRWLTLSLLTYVAAAFAVNLPWGTVLHDFVTPSLNFSKLTIMLIVANLGTTISPYLFFWQASEEVEERHQVKPDKKTMMTWLRQMRGDVMVGMTASNVVMFFIIVTTASTLRVHGVTDITSAEQAAQALRPIAGQWTYMLFTLGIIGTGLLAVPVLAGSAAYAVAEVFGWHEGLSRTFRQAPQFYLAIAASVVVGVLLTAAGVSPITMLLWAAVVNGLVAPVMLFILLRLADDTRIVGVHRHPGWVRWWGWLAFVLMSLAAILLLVLH
jgi:NRAMP (natural resistance-associated macrophage protein)-like metal ion transporter